MLADRTNTALTLCETSANPEERECRDLAERARHCLRANAHRALRFLTCECGEGVLILRGRVSSYYDKQLAQESVRHIPGIKALLNVIEVAMPPRSL